MHRIWREPASAQSFCCLGCPSRPRPVASVMLLGAAGCPRRTAPAPTARQRAGSVDAASWRFARTIAAYRLLTVTESPLVSRQQPRKFPSLASLTMIVRPPGNPLAIKTFTDDELAEAEAYAEEHGTVVERFPLER